MERIREQTHSAALPLPVGTSLHRRYSVRSLTRVYGCTLMYAGFDYVAGQPVSILEFFPASIAFRQPGTMTVSPKARAHGELFFIGLEAFQRQYGKLLQTIGSPNILSVFDVFFENGTAYAVTEPPRGATLSAYLHVQKRPLSDGELVYIARALTDALLVAHACNTLHFAISEDTILLCPDGTVKLVDFAAGRMTIEKARAMKDDAPEADILALGETLYRAYVGAGRTEPIPRSLTALFDGMLGQSPSLRFASVFDLRYTVESIDIPPVRPNVTDANLPLYENAVRQAKAAAEVAPESYASEETPSTSQNVPQHRGRPAVIIAMGAVLLALLGVLIWVLAKW